VTGTSVVSLVSCSNYDPHRVLDAVRRGLGSFDVEGVVRAAGGRPVLLKPNLLRPAPAERGVTTHPAVFTAVARVLQERGARLTFGDSPNGVFTQLAAARASGVLSAAQSLGIGMADFETGEDVPNPLGRQNRRFHLSRGVMEAGAVVNLPRLKTHVFLRLTSALKNTFGVVPGGRKAEFHLKHPDEEGFSRMIADLNTLVPSRLVVLDAVTAMEGNGPGSGTLVDVGLLIVSDDPVAADSVGCRIMGIDPLSVPLLRIAQEWGLGNADPSRIECRGEDPSRYAPRSFALPVRSPTQGIPPFLFRVAKQLVVAKPVIDPSLCTGCGDCVRACPTAPRSLSHGNGSVPVYASTTCIRCYCCHEACRQAAISVRPAPLGRFFAR
jgi:uncharacterized protein (DUF362 family)/NAD-dependent dihydropyrimidine dehydrogenase PreA subunit